MGNPVAQLPAVLAIAAAMALAEARRLTREQVEALLGGEESK